MLTRNLKTILPLSIAAFAVAATARAEPVRLGPGSSLTIEGDSNLHKYELRATRIDAAFTLEDAQHAALVDALRAGAVKSAEVTVAVGAFASGERGLDENMRKALRASQTPFIRFQLTSYEVLVPAGEGAKGVAAESGFGLSLHGILTVAGVDKKVDVAAQAVPTQSGLRLTGVLPLRMTDFKVDPPTFMLGAMRCKDEVTARFELELPRAP